jgi:hypothetical protein
VFLKGGGEVLNRLKEAINGLVDIGRRPEKEWFEDDVVVNGVRYPRVSKFSRPEFSVPVSLLVAHWSSWSRKRKATFAAAFGVRAKLTNGDCEVLKFLMKNGNSEVWSMVAALIAREYPDHDRALAFLLDRVKEAVPPIAFGAKRCKANYYQALGILGTPECVDVLKEALAAHRQYVNAHTSLHWWKIWKDRLVYLDYLWCSAELFRLTGEEEYRTNLKPMLEHHDIWVRRMARSPAKSTGIAM